MLGWILKFRGRILYVFRYVQISEVLFSSWSHPFQALLSSSVDCQDLFLSLVWKIPSPIPETCLLGPIFSSFLIYNSFCYKPPRSLLRKNTGRHLSVIFGFNMSTRIVNLDELFNLVQNSWWKIFYSKILKDLLYILAYKVTMK